MAGSRGWDGGGRRDAGSRWVTTGRLSYLEKIRGIIQYRQDCQADIVDL